MQYNHYHSNILKKGKSLSPAFLRIDCHSGARIQLNCLGRFVLLTIVAYGWGLHHEHYDFGSQQRIYLLNGQGLDGGHVVY